MKQNSAFCSVLQGNPVVASPKEQLYEQTTSNPAFTERNIQKANAYLLYSRQEQKSLVTYHTLQSLYVCVWLVNTTGETFDNARFRLCVSSHLYWLFEFRGWAFGEFSMVPNIGVLSVIRLMVGNHDFDLQFYFDSTRFRCCKGCAYHFLFHACILWYSNPSAHKWYQMLKCISWLCTFKP